MQRATTCTATRRDGSRCGSTLVAASGLCFMHDPDRQAAVQDARRKGGKGRANARRVAGLLPERLGPTLERLEAALIDVLSGTLDARQAGAAAALARAIVSVFSAGELEQRLRRLEEANGVHTTRAS